MGPGIVHSMVKAPRDIARKNQLLGAMESSSRGRINLNLETVNLPLGTVVCEAGGLLRHVYFPEGAVLSLLTVLENGSAIETANIGREEAECSFAANVRCLNSRAVLQDRQQ